MTKIRINHFDKIYRKAKHRLHIGIRFIYGKKNKMK